MTSSNSLTSIIVTLIRAGDADILNEDLLLAKMCKPENFKLVRAAARAMNDVTSQSDYVESPAFIEAHRDRTEAFRSMAVKLNGQPERRHEYRVKLLEQLQDIMHSDTVFSLVPAKFHPQLHEARRALQLAEST